MSEEIISRRKILSIVGLAASLAVPAAMLTASDVEAQQSDQTTAGGQTTSKKKANKKKTTGTAPKTTQPKAQ